MKKSFPGNFTDDDYIYDLEEIVEYDLNTLSENLSIVIDNFNLEELPQKIHIIQKKKELHITASEFLYPKDFWEHKYSLLEFVKAIDRGVHDNNTNFPIDFINFKFIDEGPEDGIFISWKVIAKSTITNINDLISQLKRIKRLLYKKAILHLEGPVSVLVLGKDTDEYMENLKKIADVLKNNKLNPIIIKEEEDFEEEKIIQKVLRRAFQSKYIIIENTTASGHLIEFEKLKLTEKIIAVLQKEGDGATWLTEDSFIGRTDMKKFTYSNDLEDFEKNILQAILWAEEQFKNQTELIKNTFPWLNK